MKTDSRETHRSASGVSVSPGGAARPLAWLPMAIFIALAALGVGLRWLELGRQSLWFDEGYSAWVAKLSPAHIVAVIANDVSPPLYYLLLHGWTRCFGENETALRAFSALAGTVALCIFMDLALRLIPSWPTRIMAIALFAFSPLAVQFSQEARSYSLSAMFALGSLWGMFVFLDQNKLRPFMIALVCAGASVWLHNMMWFYLAALNAAWLLAPARLSPRARLLSLVLLDVIVVAAYLPWVPSLLGQMRWLKGNFWATVPSLNSLNEVLGLIAGSNLYHMSSLCHILRVPGMIGVATQAALCVSAGLLLLAALGRGHDPRPHQGLRRLAALSAFAILPVLAVFIHAQSGQSYFIVKIFATSALVFPLAIAMAVDRFPIRRVGLLLGLVLLTASLVSTWGYFRWDVKEDWRGASRYVNTLERKGTLVVFLANEGEYLYDYYCRRDGVAPLPKTGLPQGFFDIEPPRTIQRVKSAADMDRLVRRIDADQISRVVLVLSHTPWSDPANVATTYMNQHFTLGHTQSFALVEVREYSQKGKPAAAALLDQAAPWTPSIDDISRRRQAVVSFASALFNLDDYPAGQRMLQKETDAAWRSKTLTQLASLAGQGDSRGVALRDRSARSELAPAAGDFGDAVNASSPEQMQSQPYFGRQLGYREVFQSNLKSKTVVDKPVSRPPK